jgi:hypothetical protein
MYNIQYWHCYSYTRHEQYIMSYLYMYWIVYIHCLNSLSRLFGRICIRKHLAR